MNNDDFIRKLWGLVWSLILVMITLLTLFIVWGVTGN